jgi:chromosome segregation ATPase
MTDQIMMQLAKMQTKLRGYELDQKKYVEQLHERDREINELRAKLDSIDLKEKMIAKNQSYLELKALKDKEQIKENNKLKEGNNDQAKSKPGRSTTK